MAERFHAGKRLTLVVELLGPGVAVRARIGFGNVYRIITAVLAGLCLALAGEAIDAKADTLPARTARLTFIEGYVAVDRTGTSAGNPAVLNMPLIEGQSLSTGEDGQAEIEFEDGSVARLTPNTIVNLSRLGTDSSSNLTTRLSLVHGLAYFELRSARRFAYTVDAGGDLISPAENTTVRVNLDSWPAAIAVLDGAAHVERTNGYRTDIRAGETFRSDQSAEGRYFLTQEIASDSWDQWNETRDQAAADAAAKQTTARDDYAGNAGYGWSDLDANGSWYSVPGQGQVWQPSGGDAADFDPYGYGNWVWYPGAGYTWASGYAWGWTPFRCGGWSYWNTFGWGWTPNAACGGFGFAGYGGFGGYGGYGGYGGGGGRGGLINVVLPPRNYPVHRPINPDHPGIHPIIPVRTGLVNIRPTLASGPPRIAGVVATPLRQVGNGYTPRGGSAVGSSLRRDFPVDRQTHTAVLGVEPSHTAVRQAFVSGGYVGGGTGTMRPAAPQGYGYGGTQSGTRPGGGQGAAPGSYPAQGSFARPGGQAGQAGQTVPRMNPPQNAPQVSSPQMGAPPRMSAPQSAPTRSYSPPPAPASHAAPAPAAPSSGGGRK